WKLSLKGYRFLTCQHLSLLYFPDESSCRKRMRQLHKAGLIQKCFTPVIHEGEKRKVVYTLAGKGVRELARASGANLKDLVGGRKFSAFFLEHELRISNFMCSLEAALKQKGTRLLFWKSQKGLRSLHLRVANPWVKGEKIRVVPDGLFSIVGERRPEHFFLEADRGTMALPAIAEKMLGYIQFYRSGAYQQILKLPHFRVLVVTTTQQRRQKMMEELRQIGYCPNMFLFGLWHEISPERILTPIWLKCRGEKVSLLD
ncbi:replication-relaxation family protein, partial [candidate division NPL-UPA2 bacterium]|nr:replication-relaxation family protein [candidate division NPL-UPA2 bacterium]